SRGFRPRRCARSFRKRSARRGGCCRRTARRILRSVSSCGGSREKRVSLTDWIVIGGGAAIGWGLVSWIITVVRQQREPPVPMGMQEGAAPPATAPAAAPQGRISLAERSRLDEAFEFIRALRQRPSGAPGSV